MAIITKQSKVRTALELKENKAYFSFGKTSPWENEKLPPSEDEATKELEEVIGYKEAMKQSLCRKLKDSESTNYPIVTYKGEKWVLIPDAQAYVEETTHVLYEATLSGSELPLGEYRQVGLQLGLKRSLEVPELQKVLIPSEVLNKGILHVYSNNEPLNRTAIMKVTERFIVSVTGE